MPSPGEKKEFEEAAQHYLEAIAAGIPDPYKSACVKLDYAVLLMEVGGTSIGRIRGVIVRNRYFRVVAEAAHYAREAEKDLRKHLRKYPDDVAALRSLAEAIEIYQENEKLRAQRLASIEARIKEAEMRQKLKAAPPAGIAPPGEGEPPYPENWNELVEAVKRRDGYRCSQCGASNVELHVHHIVPLSIGGSSELDNLATLCDACHGEIHPRMGRR
ncbi:MAG: HNH endonuclease [Chloroflexota bacterium]